MVKKIKGKIKLDVKHYKKHIEKGKQTVKRFLGDILKSVKVLTLDTVFRDIEGKAYPYIKGIEDKGNFVIVRLKGSIDAYTIPEIEDDFEDTINKRLEKNILLDFKAVNKVDSSTLAAIIALLDKLQEFGLKLGIINATDTLKNYLKIERVEALVKVYRTEQEAVQELNSKPIAYKGKKN